MNCKRRILALSCSLIVGTAAAQTQVLRDSIIPEQTIEIHQVYTPEIARPVKPEVIPSLPNIDTTRPTFSYVVPQQTLTYTYHSVPIRPLALGKQVLETPFQNYLKAGLGSLSSLYFDAGIAGFRGERFQTAFHASHLSQHQSSTRKRSTNTEVSGEAAYATDLLRFSGKLDFSHLGVNYYGYDQEQFFYGKNAIRQGFTGVALDLAAENSAPNELGIDYRPELRFSIFGDQYDASENALFWRLPVSYQIDSTYFFSLQIRGQVTSLLRASVQSSNNYLQIAPAIDFLWKKAQVHIGLSPTVGKGNEWFFLPDLKFKTQLFRNSFAFVGGWKGDLILNTYQELSTLNPFLRNIYPVTQTKRDAAFAGFETKMGQHLSFGAHANWKQWQNKALFVNDYLQNADGKQFQVVFDERIRSFGLDAHFHYQIAKAFALHLSTGFDHFYETSTFQRVWHEPQFTFQGQLRTEPLKNLHLSATLDYWGRRSVLLADSSMKKLPAFLDLGLHAEYLVASRFSVFLHVQNLLNGHYQRWHQYNNFGLHLIGGVGWKF